MTTQKAVEQLELLTREREQADKAREKLGLDATTFALYWHLQGEGLEEALPAACKIIADAARYPNQADTDDEVRQLTAEIYRSLMLRKVDSRKTTGREDS